MNNELIIEFDGNMGSRVEFLDRLKKQLIDFLDDLVQVNVAVMFFKEIVKNIYDHAEGKGVMTLVKGERGIYFRIKDFGKESYDFEILKTKGSSKAGNGTNFGIGLGLIEGMADGFGVIDFKIDCSKGFVYSGIYPYEARH